jgi:hypothetical protein
MLPAPLAVILAGCSFGVCVRAYGACTPCADNNACGDWRVLLHGLLVTCWRGTVRPPALCCCVGGGFIMALGVWLGLAGSSCPWGSDPSMCDHLCVVLV